MSQITTTEISEFLQVTGTKTVSGAVRLYASYTITTNATYVTISGNIYAQYKNSGHNPRTSFDITGISLKIGTQSIVSGKTKSLKVVNTYSDWTSSASITSFTHTINRPASESDYKTTATLTGKVELTVWSTSDTSKVAYGSKTVSGSGEITAPHRLKYTIAYHPNGGNGTGETYTKYAGETHSVKSNPGFSRVGYAFSSWNTKAGGTGTKYSPGANYSADADVTLYAQWAANSYTVTLNKNSGSGGLDSVSARYDAAMPKITVPTKSGWTFQGYYDTSAATGGTQYYTSSGASARSWNKASNTTLYARWSRTITFIHGKSKASSSTATQYYGGNVTPPSITAISGWTAKGWREDTGTSGPIYGTGSFAYTSSTTTLYAIYSRTLKLSYTNGGGSGTAPAQQESTQYYNTNGGVSSALFTLPSNTFTAPSDQGGGWAFSKWGVGTAGTKWYWSPTVDASTTTSTAAVWTRTVTFKSGINSATSKTATQTHGSAVSVPSGTVTPSGWSHLGWRTDTTASTANYSGSSISPSVTTVYAVFSRTLTLTYTGGGGTGTAPSNTTATQYYNSYGNKSTASFTLRANTFTRAGYYFSKWGAGNANATWSWSPAVDAGASTSTAAQWTSYYVTLRYNVNGGSVSTGTAAERWRASNGRLQRSTDSGATWSDVTHNIYTYSVAGDSTTNMWNVGTPPILKTGYSVVGTAAWNTKTDGTGIALNQDYSTSSTDNAVTAYRLNGNKDLTANITVDVYPKWVANTYTVTLHRSNGTGGTDSVTATYDAAMPKINIPTRTGYDFSGYYDATSGGTQYYTSLGTSARSWNKTANTTLYAHWTEKTAVLTYDKSELSSANVPSAITMKYTTETTLTKGTAPSGYVFYGWATSDTRAKAGNKDYEGTAVYKKANVVPTNATLYAIWYSRVYYNANGHGTAPSTANAFYNSKIVAEAALSATGYTFNGWNTKADGTGTNFTAGSSVVKAANAYKPDISLYAKWTANQYTITLNKNNGSGGSTSVTATYDVAMPSATMPTRPGYVFQGYYDAASGGTQYYTSAGASARNWNKASNTTLYAQWAATAPFTSGDYTFTVIDTGKVQAQATDKNKITYEPIPVTVTDPVTHTSLKVTSINNCFAGCDNLQGDIFVSHPIGQLESYTNVFTTTKPVYILATNSSPSHSIWQSIANSKSNITYLSADDYYSYVVNPSTHKYSIQTLSKTLTSYGNPKATLTSTTTWTADSMVGCFEGCEKLANAPVLPNTITNMSNCFKGCKALGSAPTIPNTVTNMDSCFYGCTNLISASTIPANVNTMVNCFYGCSGLRGNIIVKNSTVTSTNMFSNAGSTQNQIYIINGSNGDSTIANTWSSIANNYTNVHYEINDLNLSNATFSVTRQIYTNDSTNSISGYVGGYIKSNFNLNFTDIKGLPVGWTVNWNSTKPVEKMGNETFKTAITTQRDSNKLFFTHIENFLLNNNDITLTNYYTITTTDNRTFNKNHTYTATLADKNKQIINADYKDTDYIYTIIDTESTPKKVAAYAFNRTKQGYTTIPSTITINGTSYTVTSLYLPAYNSNGTLSTSTYVGGCFEGCINLTTAPTIPSTITDIRNCFKNCNNLTGNVVVNGNPSNYTNMFTGTSKPIYIINGGVSTVPNFWKNNIVNQYSNVYFEGDNNAKPIITSIIVSRGNYYSITTGTQDDAVMIWEEDDTDVWIRLDIGVQLQKTYLPTGWTNELIKSITVIFDDNPSIPGDNFFVEGEVLYRKTQSKTLKTQEQYYTRSGDTYTLVSNPTQTALNNGDYYIKGYNPDRIIIYFKAVKQVDGYEEEINYQTNVKVGITDFYRHEGIESAIVYAIFAMLDFLPGGHGMAIGQPSFKEGLEIGLPVLIGEELIPPYESDTYIPVRGHMAQAGKTYYKFVNNNYIQVTNPNDNTGFAEFEEYYEKVTAVDLNNRQLIVGKYNKSDSSTENAFFVIGNGIKSNRSNLLVANSEGIRVNGNIYASYLNQSSAAEIPTTSSYIMYANSDGFLRKSTLANIKAILGLGSNAYSSVDYLPLTGGTVTGNTSFTNSVSITDLTAGQLIVNGGASVVNGLNVNGLLRITNNSNTVTIGSQNSSYTHIYNSASIPFIFNNSVLTTNGTLGNTSYPFNGLYLKGSISYKGTQSTGNMIKFKDNTADIYGNGIIIGDGGLVVVGAGESADSVAAQYTAGTENLYLAADGGVEISTNVNSGYTHANTKKFNFDTNGDLHIPRYGYATYLNQSSGTETPTDSSNWIFTNSDGFLRKSTRQNLESHIYPYEAKLQWGGQNYAGTSGPLDAALVPELGANRFAFAKAAGITVQYSRNGGSSWTDYGLTDAQKTALFSSGNSVSIGKADSTNKATANGTNYQLQVILSTSPAGIYTEIKKFAIYVSTNGSNSCTVTIQRALESTPTTFVNVATDVPLSGWSGWNIINVTPFTTYGNTTTTQNGRVKFIFKANGGSTNYTGLQITKIQAYGGVGWTTPSNMALSGHLYAYDSSQNATFPAQITATQFNGSLNGRAIKLKDYTNNNDTWLDYGAAALTSCTYLGAWNGYRLGSIAASKFAPAYKYSTTDLTAGTSDLTTGTLYFVYA